MRETRPQIAAAAALYLNKYKKDMAGYTGFEKVEAVRNALFKSATPAGSGNIPDPYFGNGLLNAYSALQIPPEKKPETPADDVSFPFWQVLLGGEETGTHKMFELEIMQLWHQNKTTRKIIEQHPGLIDNTEKFEQLSSHTRHQFITALIKDRHTSNTLKKFLKENNDALTR